jgi:hypothetical protein
MSINGIGVGYPTWREAGKTQKNQAGTGFAGRMAGAAGNGSPVRNRQRTTGQTSALEAYQASAAYGARSVKPAYDTYESENYRIVPDNEAGCFDIYNKQGERLGAFDYSDCKVRQDSQTGKQFLISEHGTMSYDAVVMDEELKEAMQNAMGVETLETEELSGFTLKTHSGTGIQYLVRDGEEGRGGKVLLQSDADREKYEALAETYFNQYPNQIHDKNAAYIWADLEIKGLARRTEERVISTDYHSGIGNGSGLTTWYKGRTLEEWAKTDPKYTDKATGFSWYVRDGKHPYMKGEDAEKFKKMCEETGESWLKKFAEMTGTIQHLNDNTTAYVGTNGTVVKSKDGKALEIDTSSMTYDMIMNLLKNL